MRELKSYFENLPVQRKITFAVLLTYGTALAVTATAIFLAQRLTDHADFDHSVRLYAVIPAALLGTSVLLAMLLSSQFQRLIAIPALQLAAKAESDASNTDSSLDQAQDEAGRLSDAFNDAALRQANEMLGSEIAEHKHTKAALQASESFVQGLLAARQRAEEAVESLQNQLTLTSRQAGMAEVATGVLHNVGNVLNSVNVSANLIDRRLRESRVHKLVKALSIVREHRSDLGPFFNDDPKGKLVFGYLETLSDHLSAEQADLLQEMDLLAKNIEHINEIVGMQQDYAKLCGVTDQVQLAELVDDAIRMNLGAFERHGVGIIREFTPAPSVLADRHKVLQILVNLMRNAKYAMDEFNPPEKRLVLSIESHRHGTVTITLRDNGIGIQPENLPRIFDHGFTTKRDGHGFGLHSAALAAKEMGGQLTAHSDGPGTGATFCLELPASLPQDDGAPEPLEEPERQIPAEVQVAVNEP